MTYELVDKKTFEVVCTFSGSTRKEVWRTTYTLDPELRFHFRPVRK